MDKADKSKLEFSENKEFKKMLNHSIDNFQDLFENAYDFISVINNRFHFEYVNKSPHLEKLGLTPNELLGSSVLEFIHPDDKKKIERLLREGIKKGKANSIFRFKNKNGSWLWIEAQGKTFTDDNGNIKGIIISRDISKRRKIEEKQQKYIFEQKILNKLIINASRTKEIDKICELLANAVYKLNPNSYISVSLYDRGLKYIKIRALAGWGENIKEKALKLIGKIPTKMTVNPDEIDREFKKYISGKLEKVSGGLYTLLNGQLSKKKCKKIEEMFNIESTYTLGFALDDFPYGGVCLFLPKETEIQHKRALETLVNQMSLIIQQKQIKKQLTKSEAKYRHLFNSLPYVIGICDLNGRVLDINKSVTNLMSIHSQKDIIGATYKEIWSLNKKNKQLIPKYESFIKKIKKTKKPVESVIPIFQSKGGVIWVHLYTSFLKLNGKRYIQFILQDITEKKRAKEQLKESEEKYREIFEGSRDGFVMVDGNGKICDANKAYCDMVGYSLKELKSLNNFYDITPKEYWEWESKEIWNNRLLKKGYSGVYEKEYIRKDGTRFPVELQSYAVFNENGNTKYLWGIARDITERKQSEQELKASEKKYRELTELLPDIIYEADIRGNITYANSKAYKEFGYSEDDVKKGINILDLIADNYKERGKLNIQRILEGNETGPSQYLMVRKNGTKFYARINSRPVFRKGKPIGLMGTVSNIHKTVLAKKKIKESQQRLEQLNKVKSDLFKRTSHELKTPLVSIKGFLNLLLKFHADELSEKAINIVNEIAKGSNRLEKLIKDILDAAQLESGKITLKKTRENINSLIEMVVQSLKGATTSKNHSIKIKLEEDMNLEIEKEKIIQVLDNLILNAIKNTPEGGNIHIKSIDKPQEYIIGIRDNGIGLTEEEKEILFTQFGKITRKGQYDDSNDEGSGLGLYISKKIIELHNGNIWVESEGRNKGSTFYFSLPKN